MRVGRDVSPGSAGGHAWSSAAKVSPEVVPPEMLLGFALAVFAVFARVAYLHEIVTVMAGAKLYILYLTGVPALLCALLTGGVQRAFEGRPVVYWTAFVVWFAAAIPFSAWPGGSLSLFSDYLKTAPVMLLLIAGMAVTWRQCKAMMWAFALAGGVGVLSGRLFASQKGAQRLSLEFGSVANANDFAAHLLLLLPFLLWVVLSSRSVVLRVGAFAGIGLGSYLILRTASRGAVLALAVDFVFFLWRGTVRQRIALLVLTPVAAAALLAAVPREAWLRMGSFSADETAAGDGTSVSKEAAASGSLRRHLLEKSVTYTLEHPIFGVGPGQFAGYEGSHELATGAHGYWRPTHNTFTQIAAECGIPGLLFFVAGILSSFWLLNSTYRKARGRPECQDIRTAAFCVMLALAGFCTAVTFLNFGYSFHLPAMAGLTVALSRAAKQEFESRSAGSAVFAASWQKGSPAGPLVPPARETPQRFNRSPA